MNIPRLDKNEQKQVARETTDRFKEIMLLSQKANSFVYEGTTDMVKPDADYAQALTTLDDAMAQIRAIGKAAALTSKTAEKQTFKWFEKMMLQKVILETLSKGENPTPDQVKPLAKERAAKEW